MKKLVVRILAIGVAGYLVPGVMIIGVWPAVAAAVVLGILNTILRPVLLVLTLPVNILSLGLFTLVINTGMILLTAKLVPGFGVDGWGTAFLFSVVLWLVNWFLEKWV